MKTGTRIRRLIAWQFAGALLVVLLCTFLSSVVTWRDMRVRMRAWTLENNGRLLNQYARYVGESLAGGADEIYFQLLNEVSSNKSFGFFSETLGSRNILNTLEVQSTLLSIQSANPMVSSVGIYYPRNDLLIEGRRIRYTLFYDDSRAELLTYAARMQGAQQLGGASYYIEATSNTISFVRTIQRGALVRAAIFTDFSAANLRENIAATIPFEGGSLLVVDAAGQVLFDLRGTLAGHSITDVPALADLSGPSGSMINDTEGGEDVVSYITDEATGWRYIVSVPLDLLEDQGEFILQSLAMSALLTTAIGAILAVALSWWQARPLRPIVRLCDEAGLSARRDAYGAIHSTLTRLRALADDRATALTRLMPTLQSDFMLWLLTELPCDPGEIEDKMLLSQVSFPHPYFSVIAARPAVDESQLAVAQAGVRFAIEQAAEAQGMVCGLARRDDLLLAFVNHSEDAPSFLQTVHEALEGESAGVPCHYTVVALQGGLSSLEDTVLRARAAVRRGFLHPERSYFPANREGADTQADEHFDAKNLLSAFSAALRAGSDEGALLALGAIVRGAREADVSLHFAHHLLLEMTAELENACGGGGVLSAKLVRMVAAAPDILSFEEEFGALVSAQLALRAPRPPRPAEELAAAAAAMIDDGVLDGQLSLTSVAAALGVSPNYLSRVFREARSTTFVEYLAGAKLSYACERLAQTELSLREIAEEINYASPQYFISRFKKQYGVTPSVWREQHRRSSSLSV